MDYIKEKLTADVIKKMFAITILIAILAVLTPFKNMLLLTFIFTYLFGKSTRFVYEKVGKRIKASKKLITILLFVFTVGIFAFSLIVYVPKLSHELIQVKNTVFDFLGSTNNNPTIQHLLDEVKHVDYMSYSDVAIKALSKVQEITVAFVLALILSLFCLLEEEEISKIGVKVSNSKLKFFYGYYKELAKKFVNSFGLIIQVQITMAVINGIFSFIGLTILGFPQTLALGFMIFILSFIPVVGTIISLIPLSIIGFQIGGVNKTIAVLIFVAILHALEIYVISPRLMSKSSHLPVFIVFLTLVIAEHLIGVWGLIIGVPLLIFFMEIFEIK
jgi:Predicted permease